MKEKSGCGWMSVAMLAPGGAALFLRRLLYTTAVDVKGLLVRDHPLTLALAGLSAVALAVILLFACQLETGGGQEACHRPAALGNVAAGAGILVTVMTAAEGMATPLESAWYYLGLAAPVCLLLAGMARAFGKKPFFVLYVVVCLFFLVHIVIHYPIWSSNPQMQDYVCSLLGAMALTCFSFYIAAAEAGCCNYRLWTGMGLAVIYLCLAELGHTSAPALYLGGVLWALTELCSRKG